MTRPKADKEYNIWKEKIGKPDYTNRQYKDGKPCKRVSLSYGAYDSQSIENLVDRFNIKSNLYEYVMKKTKPGEFHLIRFFISADYESGDIIEVGVKFGYGKRVTRRGFMSYNNYGIFKIPWSIVKDRYEHIE